MTTKYEYQIKIFFPKGTTEAKAGEIRTALKMLFPESEVGLTEHAYNEPESLEGKIDMSGEPCEDCGKGIYTETGYFDDIDGVLHCNKCGHATKRWIVK